MNVSRQYFYGTLIRRDAYSSRKQQGTGILKVTMWDTQQKTEYERLKKYVCMQICMYVICIFRNWLENESNSIDEVIKQWIWVIVTVYTRAIQ